MAPFLSRALGIVTFALGALITTALAADWKVIKSVQCATHGVNALSSLVVKPDAIGHQWNNADDKIAMEMWHVANQASSASACSCAKPATTTGSDGHQYFTGGLSKPKSFVANSGFRADDVICARPGFALRYESQHFGASKGFVVDPDKVPDVQAFVTGWLDAYGNVAVCGVDIGTDDPSVLASTYAATTC